jgi:hypothetical protein
MGHDTSEKSLKDTVGRIQSSEFALVHFQRDYVWEAEKVRKLLHSICMGYPIGSLLLVKSGANGLTQRPFVGQDYKKDQVTHLVLDGQQRLTSLFHALIKAEDHLYFFDLSKYRPTSSENDAYRMLQEMIISREIPTAESVRKKKDFEKKAAEFDASYRNLKSLVKQKLLPATALTNLWRDKEKMVEAAKSVETVTQEDPKEPKKEVPPLDSKIIEDFSSACSKFTDLVSEKVEDYMIPRVTLDTKTTLNAIARIFETINNTGVKLSTFDLLVARHFESCDMRQMWTDVASDNSDFETYGVDELEFAETVYLIGVGPEDTDSGFSAAEVLDTPAQHFTDNWQHVADGYKLAFEFLSKLGIHKKSDMPYGPMIVPIAALFAIATRDKKISSIQRPEIREKISWWFWNCVFKQTYQEGASSRRMSHFHGLIELCFKGKKPEDIQTFKHDIIDGGALPDSELLLRTLPGGAIYRGTIALILSGEPKDLHSREPLRLGIQTDDHHIFPKDMLDKLIPNKGSSIKKKDNPEKWQSIDNVCNRTKIDQKSNRSVSNKDPRNYIREILIASKKDTAAIQSVLNNHLINPDLPGISEAFNLTDLPEDLEKFCAHTSEKPLSAEIYKTFLTDRSGRLASLITQSCTRKS